MNIGLLDVDSHNFPNLALMKISAYHKAIVYMLTNFDTSIKEDCYRVKLIQSAGYAPDVRIYRKNALPKRHILRDLQRWSNNKILYRSTKFFDYVPRKDGKPIREIYKDILKDCEEI